MKVLIFGLGSIGSRHIRNIRELMPLVDLHVFDPKAATSRDAVDRGATIYDDWKTLIEWNPDADAAIIASPTEAHLDQAMALRDAGIPFYIEKPIGTLDQIAQFSRLNVERCAVGYQYRFHPVYREAAQIIRDNLSVRFAANDDLLDRYGPDCLSYIAAHPIDTALWLLGPAVDVDMETDGRRVRGTIQHESMAISEHSYQIHIGPRASIVVVSGIKWSLDPCNEMYLNALSAWLAWVGDAERDERTATLADGLAALEVMSEVRRI